MNSTPDPAHLQVNYTQSMDHITNYTPQASSLHVNYLINTLLTVIIVRQYQTFVRHHGNMNKVSCMNCVHVRKVNLLNQPIFHMTSDMKLL